MEALSAGSACSVVGDAGVESEEVSGREYHPSAVGDSCLACLGVVAVAAAVGLSMPYRLGTPILQRGWTGTVGLAVESD